MSSIYHILHYPIALKADDMYIEVEGLAKKLVNSGRFRIEADERRNFVRCYHSSDGVNLVFSKRELEDKRLEPRTKEILKDAFSKRYKGEELDVKVAGEFLRLQKEIKKCVEVNPIHEMKLARAICQSSHSAIIMLLLEEEVEVFISYHHNIGEMLDIKSWQTIGVNSGMQSTDGKRATIFVSCGGDPFLSEDNRRHTGDGFAALARLVIIAAQEIGHYGDIKRDEKGRQIGRYSSSYKTNKAHPHVIDARWNDLILVKSIYNKLQDLGVREVTEIERHIKFYEKHPYNKRAMKKTKRKAARLMKKFSKICQGAGLGFVKHFENIERPASQIMMLLADMHANIAPQADVYKHPNKDVEEAIACIEALARVPQQAMKWGHKMTRLLMPELYKIYYEEMIPGCIKSYEDISGKKYQMRFSRRKKTFKEKVVEFFKRKKKS